MTTTDPTIATNTPTPPQAATHPERETEAQIAERRAVADAATNHRFHGWRLLGVIASVVVVLAIASAIVDWLVIGPLEGRVY